MFTEFKFLVSSDLSRAYSKRKENKCFRQPS